MSDTVVVKFASGHSVRFGSRKGGGLSEIGVRDALIEQSGETFDRALGALGDVIGRLENAIGGLKHKPDGVEVAFHASVKGNCDLWITSSDAEAEFKVSLKWDKAES